MYCHFNAHDEDDYITIYPVSLDSNSNKLSNLIFFPAILLHETYSQGS